MVKGVLIFKRHIGNCNQVFSCAVQTQPKAMCDGNCVKHHKNFLEKKRKELSWEAG
jgi:hypothetical protein